MPEPQPARGLLSRAYQAAVNLVLSGRPRSLSSRRDRVSGRYDAARTTPENAKHWAEADALSARAANSPDVRYRLRNRSRYEVANNSYARGITETFANDLVGTGPQLQLAGPEGEQLQAVEEAFREWARSIRLSELLRTLVKSKIVDGEGFFLLSTNPMLEGPVKLSIIDIEADQVSTPTLSPFTLQTQVDGIEFDTHRNPTFYHVLKNHPGDQLTLGWEFDRIPARNVIHWFRKDRPGQARGVPEIMPALPLFAQLRRYTLATLSAAEVAASFAAVLQSTLPPSEDDAAAEPFEELPIARAMMTTLPPGYQLNQLRAEQPTTTYASFKAELLCEIARSISMPYNVAAGNSSSYNYASGRLDHQTYHGTLRVTRDSLVEVVLNPIYRAWLAEYLLVNADVPPEAATWCPLWFFPGMEHVDPVKEASAQQKRIQARTTTYAAEFARQGRDWRNEFRQIAAEQSLMRDLGILPPTPGAPSPNPTPAPTGDPTSDSEDSDAQDPPVD